jgi:hypothetical protein
MCEQQIEPGLSHQPRTRRQRPGAVSLLGKRPHLRGGTASRAERAQERLAHPASNANSRLQQGATARRVIPRTSAARLVEQAARRRAYGDEGQGR